MIESNDKPRFRQEVDLAFPRPEGAPEGAFFYVYRKIELPGGRVAFETIDQAFVEDGKLGPGGALPTNTNGGGLSYTHPGMYGMFLLVESVRQLRGEAGDRQIADHRVAIAHGSGGVLSTMGTVVLGTEETL